MVTAPREEIARGLGALLSYPEDKLKALLSAASPAPIADIGYGSPERMALAGRWKGRWPTGRFFLFFCDFQ